MPGPKTHHIFYKELKKHLSKETISALQHYDDYSIFAQGHDLFIYHDFYKIINSKRLKQNLNLSEKMQEYHFQEFTYQYLKSAKERGALEDEQVRLFIGPGYIAHHLLDAYTHPLIIFYAGDHVREVNNETWQHGIVENLIDIYLMEKIEQIHAPKYPVYKDFLFNNKQISQVLTDILNDSLSEVYKMKDGGIIFKEALSQVALFMRIFKYDPRGRKRLIFDWLDPVLKGTASFSYCRDSDAAVKYLNLNHDVWGNPMENAIKSKASFMELYQKALKDSAVIIDQLEQLCKNGSVHRDDVYAMIPNIASTHGLECGIKLKVRYKKVW